MRCVLAASDQFGTSDELARAVAIIGLPFANLGSRELQERMKFVREHQKAAAGGRDAGTELYENMCMKVRMPSCLLIQNPYNDSLQPRPSINQLVNHFHASPMVKIILLIHPIHLKGEL